MLKAIVIPENKKRPISQLTLSAIILTAWPVIAAFLKAYSSDGLMLAVSGIDMQASLAAISMCGAYGCRMWQKVRVPNYSFPTTRSGLDSETIEMLKRRDK